VSIRRSPHAHTFRFSSAPPAPPPELDRLLRTSKNRPAGGRDLREYPIRTGHYTFLADYLPYADGDGMEHFATAR